ncbi:MAG: c-type cytochrome [Putridiphycobacter sp.]
MRKELIEIETIERYLLNQMDEFEKGEFEKKMNANSELKAKVEAQKTITEAINRMALKQASKNAYKTYKLQVLLTKLLVLVAVIAIASFVTLKFLGSDENNVEYETKINTPVSVLPANDSISNFSNQMLDQEVFSINTKLDTVIENKDGIIIYIPANAFDTDSENIEVLVQSAIHAEDILYAGLSTTSNGNELETGGMFYVDAFDGKNRVNLVKNLEVNVPTQNKIEGMQLYKGEKTPEGEINWVNPKPIKNKLTPVDILSLDFFPPTYDNTLTNWGYPNKAFKDSLYYSFAFQKQQEDISLNLEEETIPKRKLTKVEAEILYPNQNKALDFNMSKEEFTILRNLGYDFDDSFSFKNETYIAFIEGRDLFKGNCAACHKPTQDFVGPKLVGVREKWDDQGELFRFIQNSSEVIEEGYPRAVKVFNKWKGLMPPRNLSNYDIYRILLYVDFHEEPSKSGDLPLIKDEQKGINPASIKTIWNSKFNNTNLATKQFEERLVWIHKSCNQQVLDLYINNLDKTLAEIDSMVIPLVSGVVKTKFIEFAKRNDGKVEVGDAATEKLSAYYKFKLKAEAKALVETQQNYWEEQNQKNQDQFAAETESNIRAFNNNTEVLQKEFKKNLCKVYDELNYPQDCNRPPIAPNYYSVSVNQTGWNNIDKQVFMATINRETTSFNYKGKKASVTYNEWTGIVNDYQKFDKINVYNIPKEFKSYVKIRGKEGKYMYKLNADLNYETVILAWTENSLYYIQNQTKAGTENFTLVAISGDNFKTKLKSALGEIKNMNAELDFVANSQLDQKRVNLNIERKKLKSKIEPIVFPCDCGIVDTTANSYNVVPLNDSISSGIAF